MSHGIQETIVLLVAADLTHQKDGVQHQPGDDERKKNDAQHQRHYAAPMQHNPADVKKNSQPHQATAQGNEKSDGLGAAGDAHGAMRIVVEKSCLREMRNGSK